jgi:hypothetical protein
VMPGLSITQAQFAANTMIHPQGTLAYISDNSAGNINKVAYSGATTYQMLAGVNDYYTRQTRPQALKFTVVAILSPTTLQISVPAVAATANATVWVDSSPVLDRVLAAIYNYCTNVSVRIPAGDYALGTAINCTLRTGWQIKGAGMDMTNFYKPRGMNDSFMGIGQWTDGGDEAICDFTVISNDHPNGGWGMYPESYPGENVQIPTLIDISTSSNTSINRVKAINSRGNAINIGYSSNCFNINCWGVKTVPSLNYSGWYFANSNSTALPTGITNPTLIFSWMQGGLESFESSGATITGFNATNCVMSTNTSENWTYSNGTLRYTRNAVFEPLGYSVGTPALDVSSNQGHTPTTGGKVTNVNFLYEGYLNEANSQHVSLSISLSPSPGVIVDGTFNPLVAATGSEQGLISRPDYVAGNASLSPAIVVAGPDCEAFITNYRIVGAAGGGFDQIWNQGSIVTVNDSIRDTGPSGGGTNNQARNVTNAAYDAL